MADPTVRTVTERYRQGWSLTPIEHGIDQTWTGDTFQDVIGDAQYEHWRHRQHENQTLDHQCRQRPVSRQISDRPGKGDRSRAARTSENRHLVPCPQYRMWTRAQDVTMAENDHSHEDHQSYPGGQVEIPRIGSIHNSHDRNPASTPRTAESLPMVGRATADNQSDPMSGVA